MRWVFYGSQNLVQDSAIEMQHLSLSLSLFVLQKSSREGTPLSFGASKKQKKNEKQHIRRASLFSLIFWHTCLHRDPSIH